MGLFSHLVFLAIGFYGGSHVAKHYEIRRMEEDFQKSECGMKLRKFLDEYKKNKPALPEGHKCSCGGSQ